MLYSCRFRRSWDGRRRDASLLLKTLLWPPLLLHRPSTTHPLCVRHPDTIDRESCPAVGPAARHSTQREGGWCFPSLLLTVPKHTYQPRSSRAVAPQTFWGLFLQKETGNPATFRI